MCFFKKLNNNFLVVIGQDFPIFYRITPSAHFLSGGAGQKAQGSQRSLCQSQGQGKPGVGNQASKEASPSSG